MISADVARAKGLKYFETMPDGRAILDFGMMRGLGSVAEVELVGSLKALREMIDAQKSNGQYNQSYEEIVEDTVQAEEQVTETVQDESQEETVQTEDEALESEETQEVTNEEEEQINE